MGSSLRCKVTGCDLDECGVCRRCGSEKKATHQWENAEQNRPCFNREICAVCGQEREQPDHDWDAAPQGLKCTRCGLSI